MFAVLDQRSLVVAQCFNLSTLLGGDCQRQVVTSAERFSLLLAILSRFLRYFHVYVVFLFATALSRLRFRIPFFAIQPSSLRSSGSHSGGLILNLIYVKGQIKVGEISSSPKRSSALDEKYSKFDYQKNLLPLTRLRERVEKRGWKFVFVTPSRRVAENGDFLLPIFVFH